MTHMCVLESCGVAGGPCIATLSILSMWEQLVTLFGVLVRTNVEASRRDICL